jgi:RNA polymerase sigma factor (sigma-70 family)
MEPNGPAERLLFMQDAAHETSEKAESLEADFALFYSRHYRRIVVLVTATTTSVAIAEEIAQDAFVQIYKRWGHIQAKEAWLRRAAISLSTSWLRKRQAERKAALLPPLARDETSAVIMRIMLANLSPRQRAAVVLKYYEGLRESEIATALKCRPGTVKSLLSRSMKKLEGEIRHAQQA